MDRDNLKFIADYLTSLDQASRSRLASKLYYLDPVQEKQETQSALLEELIKVDVYHMITLYRRVLELFRANRQGLLKSVVLLSLILGGIKLNTQFVPEKPNTLRLGYSFFGSIDEIDPNHIQTIYQSNIIENLFSRLIEYDNAGQIVCSLCSSFNIDQHTIRFFFKNSSKTIDGYKVDAIAAKASLDRIILSQTNTHGSLRYYLSTNLDNPIQVEDKQLLVKVEKAEWVPFVINLLTSMDFSIVPKESLDSNAEKIIDYRNTSGLYYVDFSDDKGNLRLRANQNCPISPELTPSFSTN